MKTKQEISREIDIKYKEFQVLELNTWLDYHAEKIKVIRANLKLVKGDLKASKELKK